MGRVISYWIAEKIRTWNEHISRMDDTKQQITNQTPREALVGQEGGGVTACKTVVIE